MSLLVWGKSASDRHVEDRLQWEEAGGKETKCDKPLQYTRPKKREVDFPGSPMVKTLCFHCRGPKFNPCSGN